MTEYTTSSEAIREYFTAQERTQNWVQHHFHHDWDDGFMSPSAPPSELDDSDAPSYGPSDSDNESTHSLPPRMILRWNDGRPDVPITPDPRHPQSQPHLRMHSRRSASDGPAPHPFSAIPPPTLHPISHHPSAAETVVPPRWEQTLSYVTAAPLQGPSAGRQITPPRSPENIVILPSPQEENVPQAPGTGVSSHTVPPESHLQSSLSRTPTQSAYPAQHGPPPEELAREYSLPQERADIASPHPRRAYNPPQFSRHTTRSPPIAQSYSQPLPAPHGGVRYDNAPGSRAPSQLPYTYAPPAIVYAPSSRHGGSRYAPPAIVYSPPSHPHSHTRGPAPSITYSHSAPLPHGHNQYYPHAAGHRYGSLRGAPSHLSSTVVEEEPDGYKRSRSRSQKRSVSRSHHRDGSEMGRSRGRSPGGVISVPRSPSRPRSGSPTSSLGGGSETSGSTYYILPTPGQKVQIIQTGAPTLYTATSTTKSGHQSPHSPQSASIPKKPFFRRIFSIPKLASSVNSRGSAGSTTRKLQRRHTVATHAQQLQHQA